jgi:hypothetical protein
MNTSVRTLLCSLWIVPLLATQSAAFAEGKSNSAGNGFKPGSSMDGQSRKVKVKYKEKTDLDFEDTTIEGTAKNPFASMLMSRDQEFKQGFIKIRYDWHDQLIMSVSGLNQ